MKKKKGFTLVELLAVIAILAILVIIALPNIVAMFNEAKKNSFLTECKQIYKTGQNKWMSDSMFNTNEQTYKRCKTCTGKSLDLSGRTELDYYITYNKAGKVTKFFATDGTYQYSYTGNDLLIEDIKTAYAVAEISADTIIKIENNKPYLGDSALVDTKTLNINSYEITFEPGMTWEEWINSSYNTYEFKLENREDTVEYNGNINDHFLPNNNYGISTKTTRYACGTNHYLTSYYLIYNLNINDYVLPSDEISNTISYKTIGSEC